MSNAYIEAANALKREAERTKGLLAAADVLDKIGSLEQAHYENEQRVVQIRAHLLAEQERLEGLRARSREVEEQIARAREASAAESRRATEQAQAEAENIVKTAEERAKAMVSVAEQRCDEIKASIIDESRKAAEHKKRAEEVLADVEARVAEKSNELIAIQGRINAAREEARKMLEG